jgi:two-component system sensor histidine kinase MprB
VSETEDLSTRIRVRSDDEVGQLARRFNAMIERLQHSRGQLDESVRAQRQLVADASHELRTPVTSLRTNVEVLLAGGELDPELRHQMLDDVVEQTEELSSLVNDLIEVARGDLPLDESEELRLDRVVEEAVARARRHAPDTRFVTDLSPVAVRGVPERLARAIGNLLDNAARHSPPGGEVSVTVDADGIRVRDHGSGFEAGDLPYVFDRFFRGINARGRQGSGLGLAIVRQVAEQHGGSVAAANAPGGGALMTLALPGVPVDDPATPFTAPDLPPRLGPSEPLTPPAGPAPAPGVRP